ncbi:MAG: flavodoxin family protein [Firmicutes bacterium]|nr:flavodoxin family protein [Bacillota bacterium]
MKVLMINGSPHIQGQTSKILQTMIQEFETRNVECEVVQVGNQIIPGCMGCGKCKKENKCVFEDIVNETANKFRETDGMIIGAPVYFGSANGATVSFLDRLFYSTSFDKTMKVGASVCVAARSGSSTTFDQLNRYFTISGMPVVSSLCWNNVIGENDEKGMNCIHTLVKNMVFVLKSIELGKQYFTLEK